MTYIVFDFRTNREVSRHSTSKAARAKANRMDLAYGAMTCVVRFA
jgi:hypothetical protein